MTVPRYRTAVWAIRSRFYSYAYVASWRTTTMPAMSADPLPHELPTAAGQASPSGPATANLSLRRAFWLALTVAVALGFALRASRPALVNPLVVHDDVRQHVFWVPRLHDPSLFPGDWIADYYQSQAP